MKTPSFWLGAFSHFFIRSVSVRCGPTSCYWSPIEPYPFPILTVSRRRAGRRLITTVSRGSYRVGHALPSDTERPVCTGLDHRHFFWWWLGWSVPTSKPHITAGHGASKRN